ncbi:MAG: hypothetical protein V4548_02685 [Bacteroidota bacterium]
MNLKSTLIIFLFIHCISFSQVGIGTITPNSDSILELSSTTKGLLVTRVALTSTAASTPLAAHVAGMMTYNTATAGAGTTAVTPGFYYNDGVKWIRLEPLTTTIGDTKYSLATADHLGWYLLDGRAKATLPAAAQANATLLGFGINIPDATDKILKGKSGVEGVMTVGGSNSVSLVQANLPNLALPGTTTASGVHDHDYTDQYHTGNLDVNIVTGLLGILALIGLNILNNNVGDAATTTTVASTSTSAGNHTHVPTVSSGGSGTAISKVNHLVTNVYVYLGY